MSDFRTEINIPESAFKLGYDSQITAIGSCFTQHIAGWLKTIKFNCLVNPFGILFNPIAIENCIERIANKRILTEEELEYNNELYCSFDFHSSFNRTDKADALHHMNHSILSNHEHLVKSNCIMITLGTAWAYRSVQTKQIVANCHKIPARAFTKELLDTDAILNSLERIYKLLHKEKVHFIFTISPVRHIKDGFAENQLSKSLLITAIHQFINDKTNCTYFPAYEIMMDDLRDYRFYDSDMIHPNTQAIEYIKKKFTQTFIAAKDRQLIQDVEKVLRDMNHRPFNPNTDAYKKFQETLNIAISKLKEQNIIL